MMGRLRRIDQTVLTGLLADPAEHEEIIDCYDDDDEEIAGVLYLDKEWDTLDALLTTLSKRSGAGWLKAAVHGDAATGLEASYGPARYLTAAQTAAVAGAFSSISSADALAAVETTTFGDAYGADFVTGGDGAEVLAELAVATGAFYAEAAAAGQPMLMWLD